MVEVLYSYVSLESMKYLRSCDNFDVCHQGQDYILYTIWNEKLLDENFIVLINLNSLLTNSYFIRHVSMDLHEVSSLDHSSL